jgi:hypothetical protein
LDFPNDAMMKLRVKAATSAEIAMISILWGLVIFVCMKEVYR